MTFTKRIFLFLAIVLTSHTYAQTISMDQVPMEDALRRLQLMGKIEGDISFMLRPIQSTRLHSWDSVLQSIDPSVKAMGNQKIDKHFLGKWGYASILPVQITQQYVTAQPFQELDGPMIASSGYQVMASAGIFAKLGPLTIQLQPQYVSAANSDFRGTKQTPNYQQTHWGNSSIRLNAGPVSVGISSENITWGPTLMNPLLMSAHAPGFMHATFNSRRPLRTPIGSFEWQWMAGYLNFMDTIFNNVLDDPGEPPKRRYFNGFQFSYQPKWIKGLSMGVVRVVQEPESLLKDNKEWNLLFRNISRATDKPEYVNSLLGSVEDNRDQYASIFLRWIFQPAQAEFYTEWGRNDAFFNMRDFIQDPGHSRGYTSGLRKLFKQTKDNEYWQLISEYTRLQQPSTYPVRNAGTWYVHGGGGYSENGQIMGAPIGSGGNYMMFRISKFRGWEQKAIQLESTTQRSDKYEQPAYGLTYLNPSNTKWVDFGFRLLYDRPYKKLFISTTLAFKRSYNYNFSQTPDTSGLGFSSPIDLNSFLFKISFRYL